MRVAILLGIFVIASRSWADSLEADFEGTFASTGSNFGRDTSYVVGDFDYYYRDYFAFDLSADEFGDFQRTDPHAPHVIHANDFCQRLFLRFGPFGCRYGRPGGKSRMAGLL